MGLPYIVATLLYAFNGRDEPLLLERSQEPNRGLWSPCGGKVWTAAGESPYAGACREAREELGLTLNPAQLHLTGIVSEAGYLGQSHWLLFLFEIRPRLDVLPPAHREGRFGFFPWDHLPTLPMPQTDREQLWPLFRRHRGGFFAAHARGRTDGGNDWVVEDSRPGAAAETGFHV